MQFSTRLDKAHTSEIYFLFQGLTPTLGIYYRVKSVAANTKKEF